MIPSGVTSAYAALSSCRARVLLPAAAIIVPMVSESNGLCSAARSAPIPASSTP